MKRLDCCVQGQGDKMVQCFIEFYQSYIFRTIDIFAANLGVLLVSNLQT